MIMSSKLSSLDLTLKASGSTTLPVGEYAKKCSRIPFAVAKLAHILFPICIPHPHTKVSELNVTVLSK